MAQKKSTRRKKAPDPPEKPPVWERFLNVVFRPKLLFWVAVAGVLVILAPVGSGLMPDLAGRDEYRLQTRDMVLPEAPRWVPINLIEQIIERAGLPDEVSVLDGDLAGRIGDAFENHPWIERPVTVRVSVPAKIEVDFEYRQPVAMVSVSDGFYPVDPDGVLLPPQDFPPSDLEIYPKISGMTTTPVGGIGSTWGDERIRGAAQLAIVLLPYWSEWKLSSIEVPRRSTADVDYEDLEFVVTTLGGSRIIWGRPPGNDHPLEVTGDQKIGRLKEFLARGKSFDGRWEININHLREITVNSLDGIRLRQ